LIFKKLYLIKYILIFKKLYLIKYILIFKKTLSYKIYDTLLVLVLFYFSLILI